MIAPVTNEEKQKLLEALTVQDKIETLENIISFYLHGTNLQTKRSINLVADLFMESKKSERFCVFSLEIKNSIPSIVPIGLIILRKTFIFEMIFANKSSSLRVPDLVISNAKKSLISNLSRISSSYQALNFQI